MSEIVAMVNAVELPRAADFGVIAEQLNQANQLHSADLNTFAEAYSDEVRGLIDLQGPAILKTVEFQAQKLFVEKTPRLFVAPFEMPSVRTALAHGFVYHRAAARRP
jgi:hypothetical protein